MGAGRCEKSSNGQPKHQSHLLLRLDLFCQQELYTVIMIMVGLNFKVVISINRIEKI